MGRLSLTAFDDSPQSKIRDMISDGWKQGPSLLGGLAFLGSNFDVSSRSFAGNAI